MRWGSTAQLEHAAGLNAEDDDQTRLAKLESLLEPTTRHLAEAVPLLATLLGIPLGDRWALPQLTSDMLNLPPCSDALHES